MTSVLQPPPSQPTLRPRGPVCRDAPSKVHLAEIICGAAPHPPGSEHAMASTAAPGVCSAEYRSGSEVWDAAHFVVERIRAQTLRTDHGDPADTETIA